MGRIRTAAALAAAMVAALPAAAQACDPQRIALPTPDGHPGADVLAFGPRGLVGGTAGGAAGQVAVLWRDGRVEDVLGDGFVADVNSRGDVLVSDIDWASYTGEAYVVRGGVRRALAGLGGDLVFARRLNDRGDAVGWAADAGGVERPVVWRAGGAPRALPLPDGMGGGEARGINERGDVVGNVWPSAFDPPAGWLWLADGTSRPLDTEPWSPADPGASFAFVIDGKRRAAGVATGLFEPGAFGAIWSADGRRLLGDPRSWTELRATSGQGDFSGIAFTPDGGVQAVLARADGPLVRLLPLTGDPADPAAAHAVSRTSQGDVRVGGSSLDAAGRDRATVWTCAFAQAVTLDGTEPAGARRHGRAARVDGLSPDRRAVRR